jgi:hypothetical protein
LKRELAVLSSNNRDLALRVFQHGDGNANAFDGVLIQVADDVAGDCERRSVSRAADESQATQGQDSQERGNQVSSPSVR